MSIKDGKGLEGILNRLSVKLAALMPAKIATYNNAHGVFLNVVYEGPFVFSEDSSLDLTIKGEVVSETNVSISVDISAGTYSDSELMALLESDSDFSTYLETYKYDDIVYIETKTKATPGEITIDSDIDELGLKESVTYSWDILDDIEFKVEMSGTVAEYLPRCSVYESVQSVDLNEYDTAIELEFKKALEEESANITQPIKAALIAYMDLAESIVKEDIGTLGKAISSAQVTSKRTDKDLSVYEPEAIIMAMARMSIRVITEQERVY